MILENDLLYPLAAMYCGEAGSSDAKNVASLKKLGQDTGIDASNRRPGQICGRVFKNGDPNYTCKYVEFLYKFFPSSFIRILGTALQMVCILILYAYISYM